MKETSLLLSKGNPIVMLSKHCYACVHITYAPNIREFSTFARFPISLSNVEGIVYNITLAIYFVIGVVFTHKAL